MKKGCFKGGNMEDLKRATLMERVLRDMRGEGNSVATLAKRYDLSEESIRTVLGIRIEDLEPQPEVQSSSIICTSQDFI
jgi:Mor family transcriptional regulator